MAESALAESDIRMFDSSSLREQPLSEVGKAIQKFSDFDSGWGAMNEGARFRQSVLECATRLADFAKEQGFDIEAHPGFDGEVLVTVYARDVVAEFYVNSTSDIELVEEDMQGNGIKRVGSLREVDAFRTIATLEENRWLTFVSWIHGTTIQDDETDSSVSRFDPVVASMGAVLEASRSFVTPVVTLHPEAPAST